MSTNSAMSQPTAHGAMAGVGFAAVGLGFALLGDVWLGVSLVVVSVVLLAAALDPLVTGDLGDAFGFAMMGAGVGVVVGGAISRTSQVWVGITTLTGGVMTVQALSFWSFAEMDSVSWGSCSLSRWSGSLSRCCRSVSRWP
jgi:hypothetical protein